MSESKFSCYVYDAKAAPVAWCHRPEAAAAIISAIGFDGWTVKWRTNVLWEEGAESNQAGESIDICADTIYSKWETAWTNRRNRKEEKKRAALNKPQLDITVITFFEEEYEEVEPISPDDPTFAAGVKDRLIAKNEHNRYVMTAKGRKIWREEIRG